MKLIIYTFIFLISLLIANNAFSIDKWVRMQSPTNRQLVSSYFTDTLNGWAAGEAGIIIHTSNGGISWEFQNSNTIYNISHIFFLNKRLGWAVGNVFNGYYPVIYSTTDGGINWSFNFYNDTLGKFNTVYFLDSLNGYIGGTYNTGFYSLILKTTDGGNIWVKSQSDSSLFSGMNLYDFYFFNSQQGIASGGNMDRSGVFWLTTNGGNFWRSFSVAPEPLFQILTRDSLNFICAGGGIDNGASFVVTSNGGVTWKYNELPILGVAYTIKNRTQSEWWIGMGFTNILFYTFDSGGAWDYLQLPDSIGIFSINFPDSAHGWAFGIFGTILKYNYISSGIINENTSVKNFELFQNYPNPFNPTTTIKYQITDAGQRRAFDVRLKVYDILGKEIATLINKKQSAGSYELKFDGSKLPSGIYFYDLETEDFRAIKKMLLLK
jgi:photosystem II stability/assembly factor-like uncharacterized protein